MKNIILKLVFVLIWLLPLLAFASPTQVEFLLSGFTDSNGQPLSGGKVYTYIAGTTTNKTTWSDFGETTPLTNPIILDGNGKKQVYAEGLYKFVVKSSADVTLYTFDNLTFSAGYNGTATWCGTATNNSGAYACSTTPTFSTLVDGLEVAFRVDTPNPLNPGTPTLNVNSTGARLMVSASGIGYAEDLQIGNVYVARYDSSIAEWAIISTKNTREDDWAPTLTPQNGTASSVVYSQSHYRYVDSIVFLQLDVTWTQNTSNAAYVDITLPIAPQFTIQTLNTIANTSGSQAVGFSQINSASLNGSVRVYGYKQDSFTSGGTREILLSGFYFR